MAKLKFKPKQDVQGKVHMKSAKYMRQTSLYKKLFLITLLMNLGLACVVAYDHQETLIPLGKQVYEFINNELIPKIKSAI